MKKLIISSLAIFALASCGSSDDTVDETQPVDPTTILPTKFTEITQDNQTYVVTFKYDGTKLVESNDVGTNEKTVYTYSGDNIVKTEDFEGTAIVYTREFTYTNGRVTAEKITNKHSGGTLVYTKNFQYLSDNHVKYNEYTSSTYNPATGVHTDIKSTQYDVYISNNGNLITGTSNYEGHIRNYTYTYDGQNNPTKNIKGFLKINLLLSPEGDVASNNLLKVSSIYSGPTNGQTSNTSVHTYNNNNFPTKTVTTYTSTLFPTNSHTFLTEYNK
ncbi:lipocalin/fatty acid-binding family protein [Chryseobacterium limigenitum]|uniref:YD repeat-containing protein n=1 Tax=Chryseobacterium limigenitum TaxID=1612149 RepID=A0A1K2IF87_9FLAO|nr:hypothetical protein [Chryseobacterium limigenitum]SFZ91047.1 hypothetical protein SAMN05216324_10223 [Chryseobacterium limigenitum]